jgi:hypothetical protein
VAQSDRGVRGGGQQRGRAGCEACRRFRRGGKGAHGDNRVSTKGAVDGFLQIVPMPHDSIATAETDLTDLLTPTSTIAATEAARQAIDPRLTRC